MSTYSSPLRFRSLVFHLQIGNFGHHETSHNGYRAVRGTDV